MKIVNLKKFIKSIGFILGIIFVLSLVFSKSSLSHKEIEYHKICVSSGETLWTIAQELQSTNDYYRNKDIRYIITDIQNINNLNTSILYVDQELLIPII